MNVQTVHSVISILRLSTRQEVFRMKIIRNGYIRTNSEQLCCTLNQLTNLLVYFTYTNTSHSEAYQTAEIQRMYLSKMPDSL